MFQHKKHTSCR